MAILTIGRVGLDVELGHPSEWTERARFESGREITIRGFLQAATASEVAALRTELLEQTGKLIAVTYSLDPEFSMFAVTTEVRIDTMPTSYRINFFPFEIALFRIGSDSRTELQSLLTGATIVNAHSLTPQPWHAIPPAALAYNAGIGVAPTETSRDAEDGTMGIFLDIDPTEDPSWSVSPASYYGGAVKVLTQGRVRAGQDVRNGPADWSLENGLIRIRPVPYQGTSTGELDMYLYSGSAWSTAIRWKIMWSGSTKIPKWHYMTIVRNDPEMAIVRLVRDAETAPPSAHRHTLDLVLRRGAPFVACYYQYSGGIATHGVARDSADTCTTQTWGLKDDATISGHRWVLGTPQAHTQNTTTGQITASVSSRYFKFWIGGAINDAADATGDGPADLAKQYAGWVSETVRAVRR